MKLAVMSTKVWEVTVTFRSLYVHLDGTRALRIDITHGRLLHVRGIVESAAA
jgi:hypothetical protein